VKLKAQHIAAILLMIIGLSIASELSQSNLGTFQASHSVQEQHSMPLEATHSNGCEDLCNLGQCHFGHCSHMNIVNVATGLNTPIVIAFHQHDSSTSAVTFSEQPTRPPRLS
jgi:hypothetical protein